MTAPRPGATITGIGLVTPLGQDLAGFFDSLCTGSSGLRRPPPGHPVDGILDSAGISPVIDPKAVLPPSEARSAISIRGSCSAGARNFPIA